MLHKETTAPVEGAAGILLGGGSTGRDSEFDRVAQGIARRFGISDPHARAVLRLIRGQVFA